MPRLALTLGDPSGVGPEIVAKALNDPRVRTAGEITVIGTPAILERGAAAAGVSLPGELDFDAPSGIDGDFPVGEVSAASGRAAHAFLERAVERCRAGRSDAMVTAPINKQAFRAAGLSDLGHLEAFKRISGVGEIYTMLVSGKLRCLHLTTHVPLSEAASHVTQENILRAVRTTARSLEGWGFARPRIAVAALNPHGGEGGMLGREEIEEIEPAVARARDEGLEVTGPIPADSVFLQGIEGLHDVVLALYHDQGHIPIKVHGFEQSVGGERRPALDPDHGRPWNRVRHRRYRQGPGREPGGGDPAGRCAQPGNLGLSPARPVGSGGP